MKLMACQEPERLTGWLRPFSSSLARPENKGFERTAPDCNGPEHHEDLTKNSRDAKLNARARFFAKLKLAPSGCLEWQGALQSRGYGSFGVAGRTVLAHRYAWELERGTIPAGLTVDHLCRNKRCVNVQHLELVTAEENSSRAGRAITHCRQGHPLSGANVKRSRRGKRVCIECRRRDSLRVRYREACARRGVAPANLTTVSEFRAALATLKATRPLPRGRAIAGGVA